jgi:uncharacterized protein (TIGR00645 family)
MNLNLNLNLQNAIDSFGACLERQIFRLRWTLFLFVLALVISMAAVGHFFWLNLLELYNAQSSDVTMLVLALMQNYMVATFLLTTILGSYQVFLRPMRSAGGWLPNWLRDMTSKELEEVMSLSVASITGVGLLADFQEGITWTDLVYQLCIHYAFLLTAIGVAVLNWWLHRRLEIDPPTRAGYQPTFLEESVFSLRWALFPFICGLVFALGILVVHAAQDLQLIFSVQKGQEVVAVFQLPDRFMVAILLVVTIVGSFHIYIRPIQAWFGWLPQWLQEMTSKHLSIVTYLALAGVSQIGLLEDFRRRGSDSSQVGEHLAIHITFILSALATGAVLILSWKTHSHQVEKGHID